MLWFYLALISIFGSAVANIFRRVAMRGESVDPVASVIIFQFIGAILVGILAFGHGFVIPPITKYPINFLLQAILWGSATLMLFKASQYLEASQAAIVTAGSSVITIISAVIVLHEHFNILFILGTALILFSIFYISHGLGKIRFNKGMVYALLYCLIAGLAFTNDAFMLRKFHTDTLSLLTIGYLAPGLYLLLIQPQAIKKMKPIFKKSYFVKLFLLTMFYVLGGIAYFFAVAIGGQASQVAPISQASIIITVLLGAIFLGEKDYLLRKIACTMLVTIGVILLS